MPVISVILPTRDRPIVLARAVASVLAQEGVDLELLVVDNNEREPPLLAATPRPEWLADPRVTVIRAERARNAAAARNAGLERARGEWITFLDDDDAYLPGKLAAQLALAARTAAPLVLCGARFRLQERTRVHVAHAELLRGDELLTVAEFGAPFLFHRRRSEIRFDEQLFAGEDAHYGHALVAAFGLTEVPVVMQALVEVYQDVPTRARTNVRAEAGWRAARAVWWKFGHRYSPAARRLFVLRASIARAKLHGHTVTVMRLIPALIGAGGTAQWRFAANAVMVSSGWMRGRWTT